MNELALFAGAGGGILGGHLLGWSTVCAVEIEPYPRKILLQRQRDGILPPFPVWDDVSTFDATPWRGLVDVVSGGFPCQDISAAGKGAGITGERSGLWKEMFRIICEVRPRFAFMENSPMLTIRGLGTVLGDLASVGYDAEWLVLGASAVGAPPRRERIWILATPHADTDRLQCSQQGGQHSRPQESARGSGNGMEPRRDLDYPNGIGCHAFGDGIDLSCGAIYQTSERESCGTISAPSAIPDPDLSGDRRGLSVSRDVGEIGTQGKVGNAWWLSESGLGRVAHGVAHKMDRLRAIGNGQVPLVAAVAFTELKKRLTGE